MADPCVLGIPPYNVSILLLIASVAETGSGFPAALGAFPAISSRPTDEGTRTLEYVGIRTLGVDTDSFDLSGPQLDDLIRRFTEVLSDVIRGEVDDPVLPTPTGDSCAHRFRRTRPALATDKADR